MISSLDINKMLQYWGTPFVTVLYRCFLNREPDPEGLKYYLGRLEMGTDRLIIIEQFINSHEAQRHFSTQQLLLFKLDVNRLKTLQPSDFFPVARWIVGSTSRNQRILLNRIAELQFRLENPIIPASSDFIRKRKYLKTLKLEKVSFFLNSFKPKINEKESTLSSYKNMLSESEQALFQKIIKQL